LFTTIIPPTGAPARFTAIPSSLLGVGRAPAWGELHAARVSPRAKTKLRVTSPGLPHQLGDPLAQRLYSRLERRIGLGPELGDLTVPIDRFLEIALALVKPAEILQPRHPPMRVDLEPRIRRLDEPLERGDRGIRPTHLPIRQPSNDRGHLFVER